MLKTVIIIAIKLMIYKILWNEIGSGYKENTDRRSVVTLCHGNRALSAKGQTASRNASFGIPEVTVLSTKSLPADQRLMPTIGNGHVAIVIQGDAIFMNGLYNGHNITSHRAKIPAVFIKNINISTPAQPRTQYKLDLGAGMFVEELTTNDISVEIKMFAHRVIKQLLVTMVTVRNVGDVPVSLDINSSSVEDTEDLEITHEVNQSIGIIRGRTRECEYDVTGLQNVTVVHTVLPKEIHVKPFEHTTHLYLLSVDLNPETADYSFAQGVEMFFNESLEISHVTAWSDIWKSGRIDITGNRTLATMAYSSLYYILSSLPLAETPEFVGLSPGDLAHGSGNQDYMGHVFWDQETWMYPSILLLHGRIGRALLHTRVRTLGAARRTAKMSGYTGARYPWETALSGLDVTAEPIYFLNEQHITGDISFAIRQYLYMTRDIQFLNMSGQELVTDIAEFWASRVYFNASRNMYEIYNVMPPDEWHQQVNNSAYTNAVAKLSLLLPEFVGKLQNTKPNPKYKEIADKIYIPFDKHLDYHPEFDGFTLNTRVKQADVVLLGYPLMFTMTEATRRNDLRVYEAVTSNGPAMTWSMFSIGNIEIGNTVKASIQFLRQLNNAAKPFNVWTENADGTGAVNFITGMGGFLQSVLFGYGGFRLHPDRIEFQGRLPPSTTSFNVTGLDYLGGSIDFCFSNTLTTVLLTRRARYPLLLNTSTKSMALSVGYPRIFQSGLASIVPRPRFFKRKQHAG
ncbi:protein-glucosylgalactosylhydroxylysine glucosidase-like isoform X2 [Crassostrea virginica]